MLFLKKSLYKFFQRYCYEHDEEFYYLVLRILLDWAEKEGFQCLHEFPNQIGIQGLKEIRTCRLCGYRNIRLSPEISKISKMQIGPSLDDTEVIEEEII